MNAPPAPAGTAPATPLRAWFWRAAAFLVLFALLQAGWEAARGSALERWWIHDLTVRTATAAIGLLTPEAAAVARGPSIDAPGGGLNVRIGCDGADVVFLLAAAILCFPMRWRVRAAALASGVVFVFVLNQLRVIGLFYAFRHDRALFDLMHAAGAPLLMVALCGLFFHAWQGRDAA